jgi:hypothetical protein
LLLSNLVSVIFFIRIVPGKSPINVVYPARIIPKVVFGIQENGSIMINKKVRVNPQILKAKSNAFEYLIFLKFK